jgi:hypothetical protein
LNQLQVAQGERQRYQIVFTCRFQQTQLKGCAMKKLGFVLLMFVIGCSGKPTFDASSEEAAEASVKAMNETMTEEEKQQLTRSMFAVVMASNMGEKPNREEMYKCLHGMTADEIHAKAAAIIAEHEPRR